MFLEPLEQFIRDELAPVKVRITLYRTKVCGFYQQLTLFLNVGTEEEVRTVKRRC